MNIDPNLAKEAKAIVALAFRNGPIEDVHAGRPCPSCVDDPSYSGITQAEMRAIMKNAVNWMYCLLAARDGDARAYAALVEHGDRFTGEWDDPEPIA